MHISRIDTWQFRNLEEGIISLSPDVNLFVGLNGQGKTNLMEAIYVACFSKSFRSHQLSDCITHGRNQARIRCTVERPPLPSQLEVRLGPEGKELIKDGKTATISDFLDTVSILGITADHLKIITEGPDRRRRFFDGLQTLFQPDLLNQLALYRRVLRQKNTLLRQDGLSPAILEPWNRKLARQAAVLVRRRRQFIDRLNRAMPADHFSGRPTAILYRPSLGEDILADEEQAVALLAERTEREVESGRSLHGPHLDRYELTLDGRSVRRFASSGQKRSILLTIYLTVLEEFHREKGIFPLVMIDDVDLELDMERIGVLLRLLDRKTQLFLTSSKADLFRDLLPDCLVFHVEQGQVRNP